MFEPITAEQMQRDYAYAYFRSGGFDEAQMVPPSARQLAVRFARRHRVALDEFFGKTRRHYVSHKRQDCMRMLRDETSLTFPQIGRIFGRDHTTVVHGVRASELRAAQ